MKSLTDQPLYKYSLPLGFYLSKMAVIAVAVPLAFLFRNDLVILLIILAFSLFVLMNTNYYILEIYEDKFKLISPNFFSNFFAKADIYYFDELSGFEYTRAKNTSDDSDLGTGEELALALALNFFFRAHTRGFLSRSSYTLPGIKFDQTSNAITEEITYTFKNADNNFIRGLEILNVKMNKATLSENNHKRKQSV